MKLETGHIVADRYKVEETLGSGGMANVYRALDTKLDRSVTLKVLKEDYLTDENLISRFPNEARAAASLSHQNIASVFDEGRDGDIFFIVLEYVEGASLKEHILKKAPFDDETILGVAIQVAEGLSIAHSHDIVHLDIKPQNILVTHTGVIKVTDFGIARAAKDTTLQAGGGSMGSVHYFSPEQARGGFINHKSDIYSLGIVMYEMATGQLPYEADNDIAVAIQQINNPLPSIAHKNPHVSESVVKIIQKATDKSASKRYKSIDDMAGDMKRALTDASGHFVEEEPEDFFVLPGEEEDNRMQKFKKRQRVAFLNGEQAPDEDDDLNYPDATFYEDGYVGGYKNEPKPKVPNVKSNKASAVVGILLGVVIGVPIIILAIFLMGRLSRDNLIMPEITGLTFEQAEEKLNEMGIALNVFDREYSDEYHEGIILIQHQLPGFALSPNDIVRVTVSLGQRQNFPIPLLTGLSYTEAVELLYELGIELNIIREMDEDSDLPRYEILDQYPAAGEIISSGDDLRLYMSAGPEILHVQVPHILGMTRIEAIDALRENMLIAGDIIQEYSDTYAEGLVMRQYPSSGEEVDIESVVNFVISSGSASVPLPSPTPTPDATPAPTPTPSPQTGGQADNNQTGTDTGAGTPDTTPEPTPTPTPEVVLTPQNRTFHVSLWPVDEGTETVHLVVTRQDGNANPVIIENRAVNVAEFPVRFDVSGTGDSIFRIFSIDDGNEVIRGSQPISFFDED